jgi:hypothetical protein
MPALRLHSGRYAKRSLIHNKYMRTIFLFIIYIVMHCSSFSQSISSTISTWSTDKSKKCDSGSSTLELKPDLTFIWKWDINVVYYGRYSISNDTLLLLQTHIHDYYGHDTYGFDSSYVPHKSISRFIIKADTLIPFFFGVNVGSRLDTIISKAEKTCSLILNTTKEKK